MPKLICMHGLPRSGKSTIVKKLMKSESAPVVNGDSIRLALHGQRYCGLSEPFVHAVKIVMIRSLFHAGHETVICDETFYSKKARDAVKSKDWETYFLPVDTHHDICKERARLTNQEDLIPVIDSMVARYEPLGPDDKIYKLDS